MLWLICLFFVYNCPTVVPPLYLDLFMYNLYDLRVWWALWKIKNIFFIWCCHWLQIFNVRSKGLSENGLGHKTENDNYSTYECNDVDFDDRIMSNTVQSCAFLSFLQIGSDLISISTDVWYKAIMIFL